MKIARPVRARGSNEGGEAEAGAEPTRTGGWPKPAKIGLVALAVFLLFASGWVGPDVQGARAALESGLEAHYRGDLFTARRDYLRVLEADPNNKFAIFNLGLVAHRLEQRARAERYYEAALDEDPYFLPAMFNLAILKTARGENEAAADLYRRIIDTHPERPEPYFNLGVLLVDHLDRPAEGEAYIRRAVDMEPALASRVREGIQLGSAGNSDSPQDENS